MATEFRRGYRSDSYIKMLKGIIINLDQKYKHEKFQLDILTKKYINELRGREEKIKLLERRLEDETLKSEKRWLLEPINKFANDIQDLFLQRLQHEGKLCEYNCVVCAVTWICQKWMNLYLCGHQLALMIFSHAASITRNHFSCLNFMEVLMNSNVIENVQPYGFPFNERDRITRASEVWQQLMDMGGGICIIGKENRTGIGHCVVSYLEEDTVKIYDPQKGRPNRLTDYIYDGTIGLKLHFVNKEKLKQIIDGYRNILHFTHQTYDSFFQPSSQ